MRQFEQRGNELKEQNAGRDKCQESFIMKRQVRERGGCSPGAGGTGATEKGSKI